VKLHRKVSVYGLTTEGFGLAKQLYERAEVYIIDETLQTGFRLDNEIAKGTLEQIMSEEPLLEVIPIERAVSQSEVIFFTPRLRRFGEEVLVEEASKFRDLSKYISDGSAIVNCVPVGLGGNSENIQIIEKQSGLKIGEQIIYCYYPLGPGESRSDIFASTTGNRQSVEELGFSSTSQNIFTAELEYVNELFESTLGIITAIELNRKAREAKLRIKQKQSPYIDQMVSKLYDLRAVQAKEEFSETIAYLAGSVVKNLENFSRYLVEAVRDALRERALKASKTKVILLWSFDKYEMRPDRLFSAEGIVQRLRDYVTDVSVISSSSLRTGLEGFDTLKSNIFVLCSKKDTEEFMSLQGRRVKDVLVLHARPDFEFS
jgi:hypothetical protein